MMTQPAAVNHTTATRHAAATELTATARPAVENTLPDLTTIDELFHCQRILVVDDEPQILWLLSRFLKKLGYEVEEAQSGQAALRQLQAKSFALIVCDLRMPDIDGLSLLEQTQTLCPDTIFIIMTAYATIDLTISALRKGVYDFLTKPLNLQELTLTIQKALRHRELTLQNRQLMESLKDKNLILEAINREEQRKSAQLRQVNAIVRQITATLEVDRLIDTIIHEVGQAFQFSWLSLGIIENNTLRFRGAPLEGHSEPLRQSIYWILTQQGQKTFVQPRSPCDATQRQVEADMIFPLRAGDHLVGLWVACQHSEADPLEENLVYLESLAAQTAAALENAQLYAIAKRADETSFINRIGEASKQSLNLKETVQSVLLCIQSWGTDLAEICLFDEEDRGQQVYSLINGGESERDGELYRSSFLQDQEPILGQEFIRRVGITPLLLRDRAQIESICEKETCAGLECVLGVPLFFGIRPIGILAVASIHPYAYTPEDGRLLQIAGRQVAMAIENARLFQEVEANRRAIAESRNTLLAVFDGILDGIYIVDRRQTIIAINRTQAKRADRSFSELVGQPAEAAFPGSEHALECIKQTFTSGKPASGSERQSANGDITEWNIRTYPVSTDGGELHRDGGELHRDGGELHRDGGELHRDGGELYRDDSELYHDGEQQAVHRIDDGGRQTAHDAAQQQVDHVVVVVRDITEQRQLEASLIQSEKMASVGQLAAGIAHEINNPLTVISANVQILGEEILPENSLYESVELIQRASERASNIVQNLLRFSRPEHFEFTSADVNHSLHDTLSLVRQQLRKADIELQLELAPDLPPIWGSLNHLRILWLNLILNARDAILEAHRQGHIQVTSRLQDHAVVVRIADDGVGMPSDVIKRIYDPFFTTKAPNKGTGLGLFNCYRAVEQHRGEIHVESEKDKGTAFEVRLPVQ